MTIEYAPARLRCKRCGARAVELLAWADGHQRQTRRLQHHLALAAYSMPLNHVATKWGLSWHTVRRAELSAIERWERTTPRPALTMIGVDEKWLGRRHKRKEKFVTIVSDLATGVPVWIGYGRDSETLKGWLDSLAPEQKPAIRLFATDMHEPFKKAIRDDPALAHTALVHDPFHVIKRAGEAVTEQRRAVFFRAGPELRAIGKGTFASGTTRSSVQCLTRDDRDADGAVMIDPRISSMGVAIRRSRRVAFTVERENSGMPSGPVS